MAKKATQDVLNQAMALFNSAPIAATPDKTKGKRKKDREEVEFGQELDHLASLKLVAKALEEVAAILDEEQKTFAYRWMAERMIDTRIRPDSVLGTGPRSTAYVTLTKRGSNRPLDDETIAIMNELNVPLDYNEKVPERYVFNPNLIEDQEILGAIAEALHNHPKLKGKPVVLKQEGVATYTVGEDTLPALARVIPKDIDKAASILRRVAGLSIGKFQIDGEKDSKHLIEKALEIIMGAKLLTGLPEGEQPVETTIVAPGAPSAVEAKKK